MLSGNDQPSDNDTSHLDDELVAAFIDGTLSEGARIEIDTHVASCGSCQELIALSVRSVRGEHSMSPPDVVDEKLGQLLAPSLLQIEARSYVGQTLAQKWKLDSIIGVGGMAMVYAATHVSNKRRVAVKLLRPELAFQGGLVKRFRREGYVANRVEHPGVVAVLDDGESNDGLPFFVMDLLVGETLGARLNREPLSPEDARRFAKDLLDVLRAAHQQGVVHRDIKPENIFITSSGQLRVLDFGVAQLRESGDANVTATSTGTALGTPLYMPPEQARGLADEVDARADVFAAGATIFAMYVGGPPRKAKNASEALYLAMSEPIAKAQFSNAALPRAVGRVLERALSFDRADRFADAREFWEALELAGNDVSIPTRRAHPRWAAVALVVTLGAGALAWVARAKTNVTLAGAGPATASAGNVASADSITPASSTAQTSPSSAVSSLRASTTNRAGYKARSAPSTNREKDHAGLEDEAWDKRN